MDRSSYDHVTAQRNSDFHLVQRMGVEDSPRRKGLDALFRCSYMGSSEYEYGALGAGLRLIREAGDIRVICVQIEDRNVYVVGPSQWVEERALDLGLWAADGARSLDGSQFLENLLADGQDDLQWRKVDAWWALAAGIAWTLDEDVAERLVAGLSPQT